MKTNNETQLKIISEEIDRLQTNANMQYAYGKPSVGYKMKSQAKELSELLNVKNIKGMLKVLVYKHEEEAEECYNRNAPYAAGEHEEMAELYDNLYNRIQSV